MEFERGKLYRVLSTVEPDGSETSLLKLTGDLVPEGAVGQSDFSSGVEHELKKGDIFMFLQMENDPNELNYLIVLFNESLWSSCVPKEDFDEFVETERVV